MPTTLHQDLDQVMAQAKATKATIAARFRAAGRAEADRLGALLDQVIALESDLLTLRLRFTTAELTAQADAFTRADLAMHREALALVLEGAGNLAAPGQPAFAEAPAGAFVGPKVPPGAAPSVTGRRVMISEREVDLLARVAASEVGHFAKHGADQLTGGVAAVVDTILNRSVHPKFPGSLDAVVNKPFQFSAINPLGSWELLPVAPAKIMGIVRKHLTARAGGAPSAIKGATHFLNPHLSSPAALKDWGNHVVKNAVAVFGNDAKKDVHFHGFAPGTQPPEPYVIAFAGAAHGFGRDGASDPARTGSAADTIAVALKEWEFWGKSTWNLITGARARQHRDDDDVFARYVRDTYCAVVGDAPEIAAIQDDDYAWSAVTISYFMRMAGVPKAAFALSNAHAIFIIDAIKRRKAKDATAAFWGFRLDEPQAVPSPGDLIACPRNVTVTPAEALEFFDRTKRYDSHSDLVVAVRKGEIDVIGGNVRDSVTLKTLPADAAGKPVASTRNPWFVVLKRQPPA